MRTIKYYFTSDYSEMKVMGVLGVFTNRKIDRESLPKGYYKYSLCEGVGRASSGARANRRTRRVGDFICKKELNLGEDGYQDFDEYEFTLNEVDPEKFFKTDFLLKLAEELDYFYSKYDPDSYVLNLNESCDEKNMVGEIKEMLLDRDQVEGICDELIEVCLDKRSFEDDKLASLGDAILGRVREILATFPEKRAMLDEQIGGAETEKLAGKK